MLGRRTLLRSVAAGGTVGVVGLRPAYAAEPTAAERAAIDDIARSVVAEFKIPGLSIAIAAKGQPAYAKGYGFADRESGEPVTPRSTFRIASLSKPITAVAIFTLIERGRLRLSDKVFGPGALLGTDYGTPPYVRGIDQITVDHLLTHTSGGWPNDITDPMFSNAGRNHRELIAWVLANQKAAHAPGEKYAYSNFGFCVLGRIIEKLSGQTYQAFVREQILAGRGIADMRIAGNTREQREVSEVAYYGSGGDPYRLDVARMDSHGGWVASAPSLIRFLLGLPDLLRPDSLRTMLTPSPLQASYARGWRVNDKGTHWHTGSLAGTTTLMVRTASGLCWTALTNGRERGAGSYAEAIDRMMWNMVRKVPAWRA